MEGVRKLILRNFQSPGDILMLTAAVRDLHAAHPGEFLVDVRTSCPALWENNPHLTPIRDDDPAAETIDCHYPLIHRSNQAPYHFIHGFIEHLNETLGLRIKPALFKGDIHISAAEKAWFRRVEEEKGQSTPFWLFASGGKFDYTIKWWDARRYQDVVDHFRGRIEFVQVGESHHNHPPLDGVVDLRGADQPARAGAAHVSRAGCGLRGQPADAPRRRGGDAAGHAAEPPVRGGRRRARAAALHRLPAPPVHPHRRGAALLR